MLLETVLTAMVVVSLLQRRTKVVPAWAGAVPVPPLGWIWRHHPTSVLAVVLVNIETKQKITSRIWISLFVLQLIDERFKFWVDFPRLLILRGHPRTKRTVQAQLL
jgi:hypothetical protein